jgi:hypothetical protein
MDKYFLIKEVNELTFLTNEEKLMKNKTIYRYFSAALLLAALFVFAAGEMAAQDFTNNGGGTYSAGTDGVGVIRMLDNNSSFEGGATALGQPGNPIPGIVSWASTSGTQPVQLRDYTNIYLEGNATKTIPDGLTITGIGYSGGHCIYTDLADGYGYYVAAGSGARDYGTGTLIYAYDGTGGSTQLVFPETTNPYYNLTLNSGGDKATGGNTNLRWNSNSCKW